MKRLKLPLMWCKIEFKCGYSLVVEREISNLSAGVRFPLPAQIYLVELWDWESFNKSVI